MKAFQDFVDLSFVVLVPHLEVINQPFQNYSSFLQAGGDTHELSILDKIIDYLLISCIGFNIFGSSMILAEAISVMLPN